MAMDDLGTIAEETMSQPRASLWVTEEIDDDLQVDVNLALGNYAQNGLYDDGAYIRSKFSVPAAILRTAAQPRIDEATLVGVVAVQHQMAQQAAFAQIPDAVKRVRITLITNKGRLRRLTIPLVLAVYCPLPSSCIGEQPRRDNGRLRQRLEPTHGEALCENRMARSGGHRSSRQRRFVSALILLSLLADTM